MNLKEARRGKTMKKATFQEHEEKLRVVDDTAKKIGVSRSDFIRMAINEKLFRLGVIQSDGVLTHQKPTNRGENE
jgi:hypothetical protein